MPFTPTHVAAIVPISWLTRNRLPFSALAIGSMIPDLQLFLPAWLSFPFYFLISLLAQIVRWREFVSFGQFAREAVTNAGLLTFVVINVYAGWFRFVHGSKMVQSFQTSLGSELACERCQHH